MSGLSEKEMKQRAKQKRKMLLQQQQAMRVAVEKAKELNIPIITGEIFTNEYLKGRTPNPCVKCNSYVKWGNLIEQANKFDAYYIATGHYARIEKSSSKTMIKKGVDTLKDQSYMLWHINKDLIDRTLLPIGDFKKEEVRQYAKEKNESLMFRKIFYSLFL